MKTAIRVFEIIALVLAVLGCFVSVFMIIGLAAGNDQIIDAVIKNSQDLDKEAVQMAISSLITTYVVILICEVLRVVLTIVSLKKVGKPIDKKPVALGILNIFFGSFVGGILLLCLNPENAQ